MQFYVIPLIVIGYVFFFLLGQVFAPLFTAQHSDTPHIPETSSENTTKLFAFLLSPLVGSGIWSSLSLVSGLIFTYNIVTLGPLLLCTLIWAGYATRTRLKSAMPTFDRWLVLALLSIFAVAYVTMLPLFEWVFDGGMYFASPIFDHAKAALVDSIARSGIPPKSPYLADGGVPVTVSYYYGWHALAAQFCIFAGVSGYLADVSFVGLTSLLVLSGMCAFAVKLSSSPEKGRVILLTTIFAFFSCPPQLHESVKPLFHPDITNVLSPGFWGWLDDSFWVPQHIFAGCLVLTAVYFASELLQETSAPRRRKLSVLLGVLLATSFFSSIFAGLIAASLFAGALLVACALDRELRGLVGKNIACIAVSAGMAAGITLPFLLHIIAFSSSTSPVVFGIFPSYTREGVLAWASAFFHFYGLVLVWRFGMAYVLSAAFMFTKTSLFGRLLKILCLGILCSVFFVHSNYYSNDFGWRVPAAVESIIIVFAAVLTDRVLRAGRYAALIGVPVLVGYFLLVLPTVYTEVKYQGAPNEARKVFASAKVGWEDVKRLTEPSDMVLSNPAGFTGLYGIGENDTNVFFSLYAQRGTPIADLIFTETYSLFYDKDKLKARFERVKAFFEGSPTQDDVNYIAQDLKVKAILITPLDGLWNKPGEIGAAYDLARDTKEYRVYLLR